MKQLKPKPKPIKPRAPVLPDPPTETITLRNKSYISFSKPTLYSREERDTFDNLIAILSRVAKESGLNLKHNHTHWYSIEVKEQKIPNPDYDVLCVGYQKSKKEYAIKLAKYQERQTKYEQDVIKWKTYMKLYYQQQADMIEAELT